MGALLDKMRIESIAEVFLPKYLSPRQTKELYEGLDQFPDVRDFYLSPFIVEDKILQGDAWNNIGIVNIQDLSRRNILALVLSNSCDIDPDNSRNFPVNVMIAPLIKLDAIEKLLKDRYGEGDKVINTLNDIRGQKNTSIMYFPALGSVECEYIAFLDSIFSIPLSIFSAQKGERLFQLNQIAHYIFLIKLSIHLTRFNESIARFN